MRFSFNKSLYISIKVSVCAALSERMQKSAVWICASRSLGMQNRPQFDGWKVGEIVVRIRRLAVAIGQTRMTSYTIAANGNPILFDFSDWILFGRQLFSLASESYWLYVYCILLTDSSQKKYEIIGHTRSGCVTVGTSANTAVPLYAMTNQEYARRQSDSFFRFSFGLVSMQIHGRNLLESHWLRPQFEQQANPTPGPTKRLLWQIVRNNGILGW